MSKLNPNAEPFVMPARRTTVLVPSAAMSKLNPNAQPYTAVGTSHAAGRRVRGEKGEERCLFMTFSTGSPLTRREISQYFTREIGQCVEYVYVEDAAGKGDPEYGMIRFTSSITPGMIMRNHKVVEMRVNGKPIWLKKYVPRSQRKFNSFY